MTTKAFVTTSATGAFVREASKFRNWISRSSDARFPAGASFAVVLYAVDC
jgi:glutathionyl-hydroquinone reductase